MVASLTNCGDLVISLTFLARSGSSSCALSNGEKDAVGENSELSQMPSLFSA